jgi:hypothetical protein
MALHLEKGTAFLYLFQSETPRMRVTGCVTIRSVSPPCGLELILPRSVAGSGAFLGTCGHSLLPFRE